MVKLVYSVAKTLGSEHHNQREDQLTHFFLHRFYNCSRSLVFHVSSKLEVAPRFELAVANCYPSAESLGMTRFKALINSSISSGASCRLPEGMRTNKGVVCWIFATQIIAFGFVLHQYLNSYESNLSCQYLEGSDLHPCSCACSFFLAKDDYEMFSYK